jgi:hypothetical protein
MGWATNVPHNALAQDFQPTTQRAQAELLARSYLCAIGSGIEPRTFWYDFRNDGDDPFYFEHNMGIVTRDFRPKPAYAAYATLAHLLQDRKLAGPVEAPEGTFAYRFVPAGRQSGSVIAAWSPTRDAEVTIPVHGKRVTRFNAVGESQPLDASSGSTAGSATVRVTLAKGAPVYLLEASE